MFNPWSVYPHSANQFQRWVNFFQKSTLLSLEAQNVIGLRMMTFAAGGRSARAEVERLVPEKAAAIADATAAIIKGDHPEDVVQTLRTKVRANAKRLTKSRKKAR